MNSTFDKKKYFFWHVEIFKILILCEGNWNIFWRIHEYPICANGNFKYKNSNYCSWFWFPWFLMIWIFSFSAFPSIHGSKFSPHLDSECKWSDFQDLWLPKVEKLKIMTATFLISGRLHTRYEHLAQFGQKHRGMLYILLLSYLVYKQIWLNLPMDDHHSAGYIIKLPLSLKS